MNWLLKANFSLQAHFPFSSVRGETLYFTYFFCVSYQTKHVKYFSQYDFPSTSYDFVTLFFVWGFRWGLLFIQPFATWLKALRRSFASLCCSFFFFFCSLSCYINVAFYIVMSLDLFNSNESISIFNLHCQFLLFSPILLAFDKQWKMIAKRRS